MKNTIKTTIVTAALTASALGFSPTRVFAEGKKPASLKTGPVVQASQSDEQDEANRKFDENCQNALASMNLDGKTWKEKADAITDYVSWNFSYDYRYQSADMFTTGGGDCWASTNLIVELGKRAGFAGTARYANIDGGAGNGHENALLQDPDGNVYLCEAGYVRDAYSEHASAVQIGSADQLAYDAQPYQIYYFTDDSKTEVDHVGPYFDDHIIGVIYNFNNTVIQIPTDDNITTLGYDTEVVANDNNNDPSKNVKIQKDDNGRWMVDASIGDSGWFQHQYYYDPFMLCKSLETVKIGKNITKISDTALSGTYLDENRNFKFEVDPDNPVYASTDDGGLVLKVNNDQGNAGDKIYTPLSAQKKDEPASLPEEDPQDTETPAIDYTEQSDTTDVTPAATTDMEQTTETKPDTSSSTEEKTVTMYRAYNPNSGEHFYTSSKKEFDHIVSLGWKNEGTGWIAPQSSKTPVYRLYNANGGEHHYTMSEKEKNALIKAGWKDEGIGWYSDDQKRTPLYRQYNPNAFANNHNYTAAKHERDVLVSIGWKDEGIGWYGVRAS